jgi:integrase/recombinase XerD
VTRLPWIPGERQWLDVLAVARREPVCDRLMLALGYHAGLRREELCSLQTGDLDPAHRMLGVRAETTKNRRERMVPYSAATGELLFGLPGPRSGISRARGPVVLVGVGAQLRPASDLVDLVEGGPPDRAGRRCAAVPTYTLRHLCLTDLPRMDWEAHAIAAFAGHRHTDSTLTYIDSRELHQAG